MHKIKNFEVLAFSPEREDGLAILEAGLDAIDTRKIIRKKVHVEEDILFAGGTTYNLKEKKRVFLIGVGKCSIRAAEELEAILGERLEGGFILDVEIPEGCSLKRVQYAQGTHPLPSLENVDAVLKMVDILKDLNEDDLVLVIISGGGSTLLCLPEDRNRCLEEAQIVKTLIEAGADIKELNTVRKHLSLARGGYLAKYAYPAEVLALIFSDIPGDDLSYVASGPTMMDQSRVEDASEVLARYDVLSKCDFDDYGLVETPKEEKYFKNIKNIIVVSNRDALLAMKEESEKRGYVTKIETASLTGDVESVGERIYADAISSKEDVLLYGGETTVHVDGFGRGGRNRHLALVVLDNIKDHDLFISLASDGWDNGKHAGAIADRITLDKAKEKGLDISDYRRRDDSETFFEKTGNYIVTGRTGSNVSDLMIFLKSNER